MKILFLDIDGVLNSEKYISDNPEEWDRIQSDGSPEPEGMIDPDAVSKLNRILSETGAKVVISSSWRYYLSLQGIDNALRAKGFTGEIIGKTDDPWIKAKHMMHLQPKVFDKEHYRRFRAFYTDRGDEIQKWLDDSTETVENFAILDDNKDMLHLINRLIKTTWLEGMSDRHVAAAIRLLNDPSAWNF